MQPWCLDRFRHPHLETQVQMSAQPRGPVENTWHLRVSDHCGGVIGSVERHTTHSSDLLSTDGQHLGEKVGTHMKVSYTCCLFMSWWDTPTCRRSDSTHWNRWTLIRCWSPRWAGSLLFFYAYVPGARSEHFVCRCEWLGKGHFESFWCPSDWIGSEYNPVKPALPGKMTQTINN